MSANLRFGLCAWSRWGDDVIDRPDNIDELIIANIINHLREKLHVTGISYLQHIDDIKPCFIGETAQFRKNAWEMCVPMSVSGERPYPDLDVVFCRWRWDMGVKDDQRLAMQQRMLDRYCNTNTRVLIWDDDFKMTDEHRAALSSCGNVTFVEISEAARLGKCSDGVVYVPYPIAMPNTHDIVSRVLDGAGRGKGDHLDPNMRVAYVGNNYERAEFINALLGRELWRNPGLTHFYGNWTKYNLDAQSSWPEVVFHPKIGKTMVDWVYQHAACVPMLAKQVYFTRGHITPRLYETVVAGGVPIGFTQFNGAERYYLPQLIANSIYDFTRIVDEVVSLSHEDRKRVVREQAEKLVDERIFDVELFFAQIGL